MSETEKKPAAKAPRAAKVKGDKTYVAVNRINGIIEPGTAVIPGPKTAAELLALDAIREPTEIEAKLFEVSAGAVSIPDDADDDADPAAALG